MLDTSVDEVEVELWDTSRARLLCACFLAVSPLLNKERASLVAELPLLPTGFLSAGGEGVLGSLLVEVRASF